MARLGVGNYWRYAGVAVVCAVVLLLVTDYLGMAEWLRTARCGSPDETSQCGAEANTQRFAIITVLSVGVAAILSRLGRKRPPRRQRADDE